MLALVAMAWADGTVDSRELAGIRGALRQLGLGRDDVAVVERALQEGVAMADVETVRMNRKTRLFTYAMVSWIAEVDGKVSTAEEDALQLLGDRLGLSGVARERASVAAREAAGSSRPEDYDLLALRESLQRVVDAIGDE